MKYTTIPLLIVGLHLLVLPNAHAQAGLRVGGSLAGYVASNNNNFRNTTGSQLGYQVGAFYQVQLTRRLSLVPEVQYSHERLTLTRTNTLGFEGGYNSYYQTRLSYLNVPVFLRATFKAVYVEVGGQASTLLGGRETGEATIGETAAAPGSSYRVDRAVVGRYQRLDFGPSAGVGAKLPGGLSIDLRVYQGLRSLTQGIEAATGYLYRQTAQAAVTYQFGRR
ncbi:porin family protein [Hymenobacter coccineus]|nr:porin family protein [Hymenobacter coccineus]